MIFGHQINFLADHIGGNVILYQFDRLARNPGRGDRQSLERRFVLIRVEIGLATRAIIVRGRAFRLAICGNFRYQFAVSVTERGNGKRFQRGFDFVFVKDLMADRAFVMRGKTVHFTVCRLLGNDLAESVSRGKIDVFTLDFVLFRIKELVATTALVVVDITARFAGPVAFDEIKLVSERGL